MNKKSKIKYYQRCMFIFDNFFILLYFCSHPVELIMRRQEMLTIVKWENKSRIN